MHIAELVENASNAVTNIKIQQGKSMMALMQSNELTQDQKMHIIELLKPIDDAIQAAGASFIVDSD